jgi:hypothetical protein
MATDSFGKTVHLTNEMADRIIEAMEQAKKTPPKPSTHKIKWGDDDKLTKILERKYGYAK